MTVWVFLLLTVICVFVTYTSFRWVTSLKNAPFSTIAYLWKDGLSHLSPPEQEKVMRRYSSILGVGQLPWIFLAITIGLAFFTVQAYLNEI